MRLNMSNHKIRILFTRPVHQEFNQKLKEAGIYVDTIPFIETKSIAPSMMLQRIRPYLKEKKEVIFTSQAAVSAVKDALGARIPDWRIFCVGSRTKEIITDVFGKDAIAESSEYAKNLAEKIVRRRDNGTILFFCGDRRRDDLPDILAKNNRQVQEIMVYTTALTPRKVDMLYNGVAFCSPSAVESYFSQNVPGSETVIFCIGDTTAGAAGRFCANRIEVAKKPDIRSLVEKIADHYQKAKDIKTENRTDDPTQK